ncbi:MAG: hypothetical protein KGD61_02280 [Candidatus Lokiarchaeota archaeon]|nr:hypothetical protein [Candidatus Lokiarchaeota archaeon]
MSLELTIRIFHLIGLCWGVGGATLGLLLMVISERNSEMKPHVSKILPINTRLIMLGIILLGISGVLLQLSTGGNYYSEHWLLGLKQVIAVILLIIGILLAAKIGPKMQRLAPKSGPPSEEFLKTKKLAMIAGITNTILWYVIVILSVIM